MKMSMWIFLPRCLERGLFRCGTRASASSARSVSSAGWGRGQMLEGGRAEQGDPLWSIWLLGNVQLRH